MSAHSGKTTRSQPWDAACRISAIRRATALRAALGARDRAELGGADSDET